MSYDFTWGGIIQNNTDLDYGLSEIKLWNNLSVDFGIS